MGGKVLGFGGGIGASIGAGIGVAEGGDLARRLGLLGTSLSFFFRWEIGGEDDFGGLNDGDDFAALFQLEPFDGRGTDEGGDLKSAADIDENL